MEDNQITNFLSIILMVLIPILIVLVLAIITIWIRIKGADKREKKVEQAKIIGGNDDKTKAKDKSKKSMQYSTASVYDFMDFEDIKDNMIIKKSKHQYLMVLGCQGINYDLMSGIEKASTEQGFLQFLNTLRYPIQIYIQTRSINLNKNIENYQTKVEAVKKDFLNKQLAYNSIRNSDTHTDAEKNEAKREYIKARNLYEYGLDILNDTEKMNLSRNIMKKNYYLILSHSVEETDRSEYSEEELRSMAFSELYTKASTIVNSLSVTGVTTKVLNGAELSELLYISYNRDDSDIIELNKAISSGYMEMYSTAKDIIDKKMQAIEEEIKAKALSVAEEAMFDAERVMQLEIKQKRIDDAINVMANMIIDENQEVVGKDLAEKSKETIRKRGRKKKEEGEN